MLLERSLTEIFVGDDFGRTPEDELEIQISRLERELSEAEAAREAAVNRFALEKILPQWEQLYERTLKG